MTTFFGGSNPNTGNSQPPLTSLRVQTSAYGRPVQLVYGKTRIASNILWYDDFKSIPHDSGSQGGKGGGGGGSTSYTYQTAVALGLCEGPVGGIGAVWSNKTKSALADLGYTLFNGAIPQSPWGYLTTNHGDRSAQAAQAGTAETTTTAVNGDGITVTVIVPGTPAADAIPAYTTRALHYAGHAYVASAAVDLGSSGELAAESFELAGLLPFSSSIVDANPAAVIGDFLTNTKHGLLWPSGWLGDMGALADACTANGIFISPALSEQKPANQYLTDWLKTANAEVIWSDGKLKFIPYFDEAVTGNGVTFTPNVTPCADLTDDDFLPTGGDPIKVTRVANADAFNAVQVEFFNRANDYNVEIAEAKDQAAIDMYGYRPAAVVVMHEICDAAIAGHVAQILLQRLQVIRNSYEFRLSWQHARLEPMDIVTVTDYLGLGLYQYPVRITEIEDDETGERSVKAEDFIAGASSARRYPIQLSSGYAVDRNISPGPVNIPVLFEPTIDYLTDSLEVWAGVSGHSAAWGGAEVWVSYDNTTYNKAGTIAKAAKQGILSQPLAVGVDPDTTNLMHINVAASLATFNSVTQDYADTLATAMWVDGEVIAYETATLTSANNYTLSYLRRGAKGSFIGAHAPGSQFVLLDDSVFKIRIPTDRAGSRIWFKFRSFNIFGQGLQGLADVISYPYDIAGLSATVLTGLAADMIYLNGVVARFSWHAPDSSATTEFSVRYRTVTVSGGVTTYGNWAYTPPVKHTTYVDIRSLTHGATYEFSVAGVNWQGALGAYASITRQVLYVASLNTPINPKLWVKADSDGHITEGRVSLTFAPATDIPILPTSVLVMYSVTEQENAITVSGGYGTTLTLSGAEIDAQSGQGGNVAFPILAGSTASRIVVTDTVHPMPINIDFYGRYWAQFGSSQWRKVSTNDATGIVFAQPFDVAPVAGQSLNWAELAWFDERGTGTQGDAGADFKLGILQSGGAYEVIRWDSVIQDGSGFHLSNVTRGAEGTTVLSADGLKMSYFPAPGPGTNFMNFPVSLFTQQSGAFIADSAFDIKVPAGKFCSLSCCTWAVVDGIVFRSPIVPLTFAGAL